MSRRTTQLKRLRRQQVEFSIIVPSSTTRTTGTKVKWYQDENGNPRRGSGYDTGAVGTLPMGEAKRMRLAALWSKWGG